MSTLRERLELLMETEINDALEAAILKRAKFSNNELELMANIEDPTLTTTKKQALEAQLPEFQSKIENKQNEIYLIRAVSLEKIRATATSSTKLSNLDRP